MEKSKDAYERLMQAKKACQVVQKRGINSFNKYSYVMESDIVAVVGEACYQNSLSYSCSYRDALIERGTTKNGSPNSLCSIWCDVIVRDALTGLILENVSAFGEASDTSDKASFKAQTGAKKYALMGLFGIATSNDPENDSPAINDAIKSKVTGKNTKISFSYLIPYTIIEAEKETNNGISKKLDFLEKVGAIAEPEGYAFKSEKQIDKLKEYQL